MAVDHKLLRHSDTDTDGFSDPESKSDSKSDPEYNPNTNSNAHADRFSYSDALDGYDFRHHSLLLESNSGSGIQRYG
jgi:hypothetical protein